MCSDKVFLLTRQSIIKHLSDADHDVFDLIMCFTKTLVKEVAYPLHNFTIHDRNWYARCVLCCAKKVYPIAKHYIAWRCYWCFISLHLYVGMRLYRPVNLYTFGIICFKATNGPRSLERNSCLNQQQTAIRTWRDNIAFSGKTRLFRPRRFLIFFRVIQTPPLRKPQAIHMYWAQADVSSILIKISKNKVHSLTVLHDQNKSFVKIVEHTFRLLLCPIPMTV